MQFLKRQNFYEFLKNPIFRKVTTDFENHTKRQAETKECIFYDVDKSTLQPEISSHTSGLGAKIRNFKNTVKNNNNEKKKKKKKKKKTHTHTHTHIKTITTTTQNVIKSLYWLFKSTGNFGIIGLFGLATQSREKCYPIELDVWCFVKPFVYFHTSCVRTAKALARLRGCDKWHNLMSRLISGLIATKFLTLLNDKLVSSETLISLSMNTILLKFQSFALKPEVCEMGGNFRLRNGLNLLFSSQLPKRRMVWSQLDALYDFQNM